MPEKLKGREGVVALLLENIGKIVTNKQVFEASGQQSEHVRRLRELRDEFGWKISSNKDRADLKQDEYILEKAPPKNWRENRKKFTRRVSDKLRRAVFDRDGRVCQVCGAQAGDVMEDNRLVRFQIAHIIDKHSGGEDVLDNLEVQCSQCNQGGKNITREPISYIRLMTHIRNATRVDQKKALKSLVKKYGKEMGLKL